MILGGIGMIPFIIVFTITILSMMYISRLILILKVDVQFHF